MASAVAVTDGITDPFVTGSDFLGLRGLTRVLDAGPVAAAEIWASLLSATRNMGLGDHATVLAIAPALSGSRHSRSTLERK